MAITGSGYLGSDKMIESVSNEEIVPNKPENWSSGYRLYKFSFMNKSDCTVIINNKTNIFLQSGQGFQMDRYDHPISSFKIKEDSIQYNWTGAF